MRAYTAVPVYRIHTFTYCSSSAVHQLRIISRFQLRSTFRLFIWMKLLTFEMFCRKKGFAARFAKILWCNSTERSVIFHFFLKWFKNNFYSAIEEYRQYYRASSTIMRRECDVNECYKSQNRKERETRELEISRFHFLFSLLQERRETWWTIYVQSKSFTAEGNVSAGKRATPHVDWTGSSNGKRNQDKAQMLERTQHTAKSLDTCSSSTLKILSRLNWPFGLELSWAFTALAREPLKEKILIFLTISASVWLVFLNAEQVSRLQWTYCSFEFNLIINRHKNPLIIGPINFSRSICFR